MRCVIVFHRLSGRDGQWELKEVRGPIESREITEDKLCEWSYAEQQHYKFGEVEGVWLAVQHHNNDVPANQPQYRIIKAAICELKSC